MSVPLRERSRYPDGFGAHSYGGERIAHVKAQYDPENLSHNNNSHPCTPAAT
jgi:hypothetical protein